MAQQQVPPVYQFTPKHTAAVKLHIMSGVCLGPWLLLLWRWGRCIDWHLYWHRVLFLTFMSVINTLLALPDWFLYRRQVARQALHPEPVFILGNPRTGTTHLHNLLGLDPAFSHATTFQAGFPSSFITLERLGARPLLKPLLSPTRPMDNMKLTWDIPAEDEIAVNSLTGGVSYYTPLVFPREEVSMRPWLTWDGQDWVDRGAGSTQAVAGCSEHTGNSVQSDPHAQANGVHAAGQGRMAHAYAGVRAGGDKVVGEQRQGCVHGGGAPPRSREGQPTEDQCAGLTLDSAFAEWQSGLLWFLKKVTFRDCLLRSLRTGQSVDRSCLDPKPLLIKSPVHVARLAVWRKMFPQAKYVYIHRHPVDAFRSSCHLVDTYYWYCYLQRPSNQQLTNYILEQGEIMNKSYLAARDEVPAGQLVEVGFDELDQHPLETLKRIYDAFGWSERYDALLPKFQEYCLSLGDFKKNQFNKLSPELEQQVRQQWKEPFSAWGYQ